MLFPVIGASLLLCLSSCWAGDPCASKEELKFCKCHHYSLITSRHQSQHESSRRRRQIGPSSSTSSTFFYHLHSHDPPSSTTTTSIPYSTSNQDLLSRLPVRIGPATTRIPKRIKTSTPPPISSIEWVPDVFEGVGIMGRRRGIVEEKDEHNRAQFTSVECNEPKSITEFEEVLLFALHRRLVDKLIVIHLPPYPEEFLSRLPSRGLRNTRIKQFEIRDTDLSGDFIWYGNPFVGQANSLLRFTANRCNLYGALTYEEPGTVNTKGLHLLPRIEVVDFSSNHLTFIKNTAFRNPPANLSSIILSKNSLQSLEAGCFQHIPRLKIVDLSRNLLKTVVRTIFAAPAKFLESINLSGNFLDNLPADFFINMSALKVVNLSRNFMHNMPARPWATVFRQLTFVDVSGNFLECDCHLLWLLPILHPPPTKGKNATTVPSAIAGQTVKGWCNYYRMSDYAPMRYALTSLTRDKLMC